MPSFLPRRAPLLAALATLAACACSNGNSASSDENLQDGGVASNAGPRAGGSGAGGRGTNGGAGGAGGETGPSAGGTPPATEPDSGACGPALAWPIAPSGVSLPAPGGYSAVFAGCGFVGVSRPTANGAAPLTTWYDAETGQRVCNGDRPPEDCPLVTCLPEASGSCTRADLGLDADGGEAVPPAPGPDAGECGPFDCASACADLAWPIGVDLVTIASRPIGNILAVAGCGFVGIHRASLSGFPRLFTWYDAETGEIVGRGCEGRSPDDGCTLTSCFPFETGGCTRTELGLEDAAADDG